jgi:DNA-binding NtrC family response regulator
LFKPALFIEYKGRCALDEIMSPKLILLVENDVNLSQSIALVLQHAGYLVTTTDCVDKVVELFHSRTYHLLISDSNIPETRTLLLPEAQVAFPHLPVIILTDESNIEVEGDQRLFDAYFLSKPVAPENLLEYVKAVLNRRAPPRRHQHTDLPINRNSYQP